jgi:hypothetical protein
MQKIIVRANGERLNFFFPGIIPVSFAGAIHLKLWDQVVNPVGTAVFE